MPCCSIRLRPRPWPGRPAVLPFLIGPNMSTITERLVRQMERWLNRLVIPDDRYSCGGCDDRFVSRSLGVDHVLRCHPEYQGVMVYEDAHGHLAAVAA